MKYNEIIDGITFALLLKNGFANLNNNKKIVNDLNVFPIPDGDTGDNMCLTLLGGVNTLNTQQNSLGKLANQISEGMLLSARGNSGVILSQFMAGIAKGLEDKETATLLEFLNALQTGVEYGYKAVVNPTEGTMLTVARESVESLKNTNLSTIGEFFDKFIEEMNESLKNTPQKLKVLAEAGVVDSGGAGLLYILQGATKCIDGEILTTDNEILPQTQSANLANFNENSEMKFGYCTELLLQLMTRKTDVQNFDVKTIIDYLSTLGDSIVAVKQGTIVKIHVHTLTPSKVLEFCQQFGEFITIKIENMTLQHNNVLKTEEHQELSALKASKRKKFGVVAVANGTGIVNTFYELGVDAVIDGNQTKNPSTKEFLDAFDKVNADTIFVLPNNGNIYLAALQAKKLYTKSDIRVIDCKSLGEGYAILSMLSFESDNADTIIEEMEQAKKGVVTCQVTKSIRNAVINGIGISENNYIGFAGKDMLASTSDKLTTTLEMLSKLSVESHDVLILIYGEDVSEEEKQELKKNISSRWPKIELFEIEGNQKVYDLIVILE